MNKIIFSTLVFLVFTGCFFASSVAYAHQPQIIYYKTGDIQINNPEISQAFYDELKGTPRDYYINSDKDFELYINLLVPDPENIKGRYSADVFDSLGQKIYSVDGSSVEWQEFYEPFGRDYYLKGPEFTKNVLAGKYKIQVYSADNQGKYVLAVGQKESFGVKSIFNVYWQLPLLKIAFFKTSVLEFFLTPFGIGAVILFGSILILLAIIYFLVGFIKKTVKHNQAKTLLLTSGGMLPMQDEIIKLLQKPAYDITVAFITTAYKRKVEIDPYYISPSLQIMRDIGFNVEEIDIEGKSDKQLMKILEMKDIIYVAGGNAFYLLDKMRKCNFRKVIKKLLKWGKVYIGSSAGTIVAGKTIQTANKFETGINKEDENFVHLKNFKGLNLVPFDIFVHYLPEDAEIIKQKMPDPIKRAKNLRILTDEQAILVQGKEVDLIGEGDAVVL